MQNSATPIAVARPRGDATIYAHKELFGSLKKLLAEKSKKGTKAPKTVSQFFERQAIKIIREEGRKYGIRLPADLTQD